MRSKRVGSTDFNYRSLYGKLFSALTKQFGTFYLNEIEDAIQNAFLKSLKLAGTNARPNDLGAWLFAVARNDLLNQIAAKQQTRGEHRFFEPIPDEGVERDLRLDVILLVSSAKTISKKAKVVFVLKTIFGLSVDEISTSTLLSPEAVYKSVNRSKQRLVRTFGDASIASFSGTMDADALATVEDILYAVFSIGFDSFDPAIQSIVNEDLCLEAMALTKLLLTTYRRDATMNLLALFCFHAARIPAKVQAGRLVSFENQDRRKWNEELMTGGFGYLTKPQQLDRYYLEALIASKYMTAERFDLAHWDEISDLYRLLLEYHPSPIARLNRCYALHKAGRTTEALGELEGIEHELQQGHLYFLLMKAELIKSTTPEDSQEILALALSNLQQVIRKEFILDHQLLDP